MGRLIKVTTFKSGGTYTPTSGAHTVEGKVGAGGPSAGYGGQSIALSVAENQNLKYQNLTKVWGKG